MIIVTGSVVARPDSVDAIREASLAHVRRSRTEPGCISHSVQVDVENPLRFMFFEEWQDRATLTAHFKHPGSLDFARILRPLRAEASELAIYEAVRVER